MSRRSRLRDLLAASNVAGADVEREKIRAARDSANVATGVSALRDLVPGIANLYGDTVKRDDDKKEKLRLEGREDAANIAKLTREDSREAARIAREEAAAKAKADAEKAEREAKAKAAETARADAMDRDAADYNLKSFAQEDARAKNKTDAEIEREKLAAKSKKGAPKPLTEAQQLDIEKKKLDIERLRAAVAAKEKAARDGKPMTPKDIGDLNDQRAAIKNLEALPELVEDLDLGAFSAVQRAIPSWMSSMKSTERVAFEKANDRAIQNVAKALEGGKLTDNDSERYHKMLMDASGSKEAYVKALADITAEVKAKQAGYEAGLSESGYRVPQSEGDLFPEVKR